MVQSGWLSLGVQCKTQGGVCTFPIFSFCVQQMSLQPQYVTRTGSLHCSVLHALLALHIAT